jgi:glycosyltransferase involved in cell wall biosynthesis
VLVAPHGVDHARFFPGGDGADDSVLTAHGITAPYVGFAGTIEPRKDVPGLVAAFARVAPRHPDLCLVLAGGDGWGATEAGAAIAASGLAARVICTGDVPDAVIPALYRRAAVVAYPSFEEGFGLPALEALACGAPLVTTTGSAIAEVVGDAALLVAPGDAGALAAAIERALDPAEAARLRAAGPARAANFTWEASVAAHLDAYERAVRAGAPR